MRENRTYGSEGGGTETNRFSLPLAGISSSAVRLRASRSFESSNVSSYPAMFVCARETGSENVILVP